MSPLDIGRWPAVCALNIIGGLSDVSEGLGVRGGKLSIGSAGDDLMMGTVVFRWWLAEPFGGMSRCDDDDEEERNVRPSVLCVIPESGDVLRLLLDGPASSMERRVLSNSVEANATSRSKPELTRSCQCDSSSGTSSVGLSE